jgi:hypothetical protein
MVICEGLIRHYGTKSTSDLRQNSMVSFSIMQSMIGQCVLIVHRLPSTLVDMVKFKVNPACTLEV